MLKQLVSCLLGIALATAGLTATAVETRHNIYSGTATQTGESDESDGGGKGSGGSQNVGYEESTVCRSGETEVPCTKNGGTWSGTNSCYMKLLDPQPDASEPVWGGRTDGAIYQCSPSGEFVTGLGLIIWLENTPEVPPPNPEVLARRAIATIGMRAIDLGIAPEPLEKTPSSLGAVGLPVWLWADSTSPNTTGPTSATASERGFTVSVSARMTHIEWDLGDGSAPITCGIGNRFDPRTMGVKTPVVCGRQNGYQKQGEYTVTATSHWTIDWPGIGESGTITMDFSTSGTVSDRATRSR